MSEVYYILIGVLAGSLAGGSVAWLVSALRSGKKLAGAETRASSAETLVNELRQQSLRKEAELATVRLDLEAERTQRAGSQAELKAAHENLAQQRGMVESLKKELSDTFGALSSAALKSSNEDFLRLASEHLGKALKETEGRLGEHKASMDGLLKPLSEALKRYDEQLRNVELMRRQDYSSLDEQIKMLATTHTELRKETVNLVAALRKPHVRGRWYEITLRNVVEMAGMSAHCDFTEQASFTTEQGRLRPDMVIHMPGGRDIAVDSKVSMEALLDSASATTEEEKRECLKRHVSHVKAHVSSLGSKSYWNQLGHSPDLVVMFISEAALSTALEADATLMEDSLAKRVLISTPTTLFALLTAVAYGWRQQEVTKNAEAIAALGRELYERVGVWVGHLNEIGAALSKANESYNRSVGSMESRVLPSVRRFRELGVSQSEELPEVKKVEQSPRRIDRAE